MDIAVDLLYALFIMSGMARKTPIDALIEAKFGEMTTLQEKMDRLAIEVRTLQDARTAIAGTPLVVDLPEPAMARAFRAAEKYLADPRTAEPPRSNEPTSDIVANEYKKRRGRSISEGWKHVLATIAKSGNEGATLDEIFAWCGQFGIRLQRPTLRAQMSTYIKRGYLGRTGEGRFFIALHGLTVAGLMGPPSNGELMTSSESGEPTGTSR